MSAKKQTSIAGRLCHPKYSPKSPNSMPKVRQVLQVKKYTVADPGVKLNRPEKLESKPPRHFLTSLSSLA